MTFQPSSSFRILFTVSEMKEAVIAVLEICAITHESVSVFHACPIGFAV